MLTVFTICSNNYLAQAKTLGDSLLTHNPTCHFVICLVDKLSEDIDYRFFDPYEIIPVEDIGIDGFEEMVKEYNITELNTAVKPFTFDFLFNRNDSTQAIIYFDPDIIVYDKLTEIDLQLAEYNIIITPHFFTPVYDGYKLDETDILNTGLYNLGFIAVRRSAESFDFLKWWMIRLKDQCLIDFQYGLYVDQLWINLVPLYFKKVLILTHLGYNVAYWNLHERTVTSIDGKPVINEDFPLVFFHFSGYVPEDPEQISRYQNRYSFEQRQDIRPLFDDYMKRIMINQHAKFSLLVCCYVQLKEQPEHNPLEAARIKDLIAVLKRKLKRKVLRQLS